MIIIRSCRYCANAYVDWKNNEAKCIIRVKQMDGSKGECKGYVKDIKEENHIRGVR